MSRLDTKKLYHALIESRLSFIPKGKHHIRVVYNYVRSRYPDLCDDGYLCSENCASTVRQPEWKHIARGALDALKEKTGKIRKYSQKGFWIFV